MFTPTVTKTDTDTKWDKVGTVPNGIGVSVQYEHVHGILYKPFLSVSVSDSVSVRVNTT